MHSNDGLRTEFGLPFQRGMLSTGPRADRVMPLATTSSSPLELARSTKARSVRSCGYSQNAICGGRGARGVLHR